MQEMEVTFARAARIWWAWLWRTLLVTVLASVALGLLVGLSARLLPGLFSTAPGAITHLGRIAGGLFGCVIGIGMMRYILRRSFGGFRVALIKQQDTFSEPF